MQVAKKIGEIVVVSMLLEIKVAVDLVGHLPQLRQ